MIVKCGCNKTTSVISWSCQRNYLGIYILVILWWWNVCCNLLIHFDWQNSLWKTRPCLMWHESDNINYIDKIQMYLFWHNHSTSTDIVQETLIKVITDRWHEGHPRRQESTIPCLHFVDERIIGDSMVWCLRHITPMQAAWVWFPVLAKDWERKNVYSCLL